MGCSLFSLNRNSRYAVNCSFSGLRITSLDSWMEKMAKSTMNIRECKETMYSLISEYTVVWFPSQGHHVARVHRGTVSGGERQPAAGRPAGDRILDLPVAAFTSTSGGSEACGCGSVAPWTQTLTDLCPAGQLSFLYGGLPVAPSLRAAGRGRLSAGPELRSARAQGKDRRVLTLCWVRLLFCFYI